MEAGLFQDDKTPGSRVDQASIRQVSTYFLGNKAASMVLTASASKWKLVKRYAMCMPIRHEELLSFILFNDMHSLAISNLHQRDFCNYFGISACKPSAFANTMYQYIYCLYRFFQLSLFIRSFILHTFQTQTEMSRTEVNSYEYICNSEAPDTVTFLALNFIKITLEDKHS